MARRRTTATARLDQVDLEARLAAVELHALHWIDYASRIDELLDDELMSMDPDAKLAHYVRQHPGAILDERSARFQAIQAVSRHGDPGSPVSDPWSVNA